MAEPPVVAQLEHGSVVIAAITSCTNTSNPSVMIGAGLLAKKAVERGLRSQPWVKTSLAPGSKVVTEYLRKAGLQPYLDQLGFNLVGYGCTTCIGNSGPLPDEVAAEVESRNLVVASVLSGNRNFEGRIQQQVRANYLASPPLVVAYAIAGKMTMDLTTEPLGTDRAGQPVYLRDIWPTEREIQETMLRAVNARMFREQYADVFTGDDRWRSLNVPRAIGSPGSRIRPTSAIRRSSMASRSSPRRSSTSSARARWRCSATASRPITSRRPGRSRRTAPPGKYLMAHGVQPADFNSYGARRGNHEVMMRGTFANIRLRNLLAPGTEGGWTTYQPGGEVMTIYDAAMKYKQAGVPLIILAGKEYGSGSSRDWAAKGTLLLGVRVVIAESFERIHRSNLVNMGVLPLQFQSGPDGGIPRAHGSEEFDVTGIATGLQPGGPVTGARPWRSRHRIRGRVQNRYARGARRVPPRRHPAVRAAGARPQKLIARVHHEGHEAHEDDQGKARGGCSSRSGSSWKVLRALRDDRGDVPGQLTSTDIKTKARELGFDACGVAPAGDLPELEFFPEWIARGYAGLDGLSRALGRSPCRGRTGAAVRAHGDRHRHRLQHRTSLFHRVRRPRRARRSRGTPGATTITT